MGPVPADLCAACTYQPCTVYQAAALSNQEQLSHLCRKSGVQADIYLDQYAGRHHHYFSGDRRPHPGSFSCHALECICKDCQEQCQNDRHDHECACNCKDHGIRRNDHGYCRIPCDSNRILLPVYISSDRHDRRICNRQRHLHLRTLRTYAAGDSERDRRESLVARCGKYMRSRYRQDGLSSRYRDRRGRRGTYGIGEQDPVECYKILRDHGCRRRPAVLLHAVSMI